MVSIGEIRDKELHLGRTGWSSDFQQNSAGERGCTSPTHSSSLNKMPSANDSSGSAFGSNSARLSISASFVAFVWTSCESRFSCDGLAGLGFACPQPTGGLLKATRAPTFWLHGLTLTNEFNQQVHLIKHLAKMETMETLPWNCSTLELQGIQDTQKLTLPPQPISISGTSCEPIPDECDEWNTTSMISRLKITTQ